LLRRHLPGSGIIAITANVITIIAPLKLRKSANLDHPRAWLPDGIKIDIS
jgi:hypothetical protein